MIPKIIHYCWFGPNEPNELANKCIKSWGVYAPDYKIMLWNETNFNVNKHPFTKFAYDKKKYAYVTDYVRLYALKKYGGIYLDSDVELLKPIDEFLLNKAFSGFEDNNTVPTGIMGSVKDGVWVSKLIDDCYQSNKKIDLVPNTKIITEHAKKFGLMQNNKKQDLNDLDVVFYPSEFFCPKSHYTEDVFLTKNTVAIHHFNGSWLSILQKFKKVVVKMYIKEFGYKNYSKLKNFIKNFYKK